MNSTKSGLGAYRRTRNPNGAGMSAEQMERIAAAGRESQRRRQAEQEAREAVQALNNWNDPALAAPAVERNRGGFGVDFGAGYPVVSYFDPDTDGGAL